ncbi:hypothetical protein JTE90_009939 [Oedothorax gibbosus]|uniref:BTB domain-containing protein n=1 Tax=Oedothorax gibbosus TaxID=931172 RepID=A0AAV6UJK3_9ARAC|nr:hypothetical protein JTE90_009939 [Oedothorax gibbosus]
MSCGCETKCFTITWKIENFSTFSSAEHDDDITSPVWKTETTEDYAWWRFLLFPSRLDLKFALIGFKREMKEKVCKYEMSVLTSSGEVKLRQELCDDRYCCSYKIEKNKIFGETSDSFLLDGTLTLYCRIWLQKLKPGLCFLRTALHEVNVSWIIEGVNLNPGSIKRSLHEQEKMLLTTCLYKYTTKYKAFTSTHKVRIELLPYYGKWSTFISCHLHNDIAEVISRYYFYPAVGWEWDIRIDPEECPDGNLRLEFKCLIAVDEEHPTPPDAAVGSSSSLSRDLLQLYRKKTFSDLTLNTDEDTSLSAHKNILAARSGVFEAMFERDQTVEGRSGVVDIDDVDSETMDRLLVYLYSDSLEKELRWEQASALYYAADKYAVLPLKQECAQVLMVAMTAANVCDVLVLADRHSDEQLMSCAVDFLRYNQEVFSSPAWENLEKSNSINHLRLTTKVLRQILLQKDKK